MKNQQLSRRAMARLGWTGLVAGLLLMAGGCASNVPSASVQLDRVIHEQTSDQAEAWSPGNYAWPPDGWLDEPLVQFFGPEPTR